MTDDDYIAAGKLMRAAGYKLSQTQCERINKHLSRNIPIWKIKWVDGYIVPVTRWLQPAEIENIEKRFLGLLGRESMK